MDDAPNRGVETPLFRAAAAAAARRAAGRGAILLIAPWSLTLTTLAIVSLALPVVALAYFGRYTAHTTLVGELVPDRGLIEVAAPRAATVTEKHAAEGERVVAGEVLYLLSSARDRDGRPPAEESANVELERREQSLVRQRARERTLATRTIDAHEMLIASLSADRAHLGSLITIARKRLELASATERRYAELARAGLGSREEHERKEAERIAALTALGELEREESRVAQELAAERAERKRLPLEQQNTVANLDRALASTRLERIENEVRERVAIVAPVAGTVSTLLAERGQAVAAGAVLASIVPRGARLEAHLYAPSSAVGLVRVGDPVELRYAAFPYRRYGTHRGVVRRISGSALPGVAPASGAAEVDALYRIDVGLEVDSVSFAGQRYPLRAGMRVEGEVMRETRRLYEWALEPLERRRAARVDAVEALN